MPHNDMNDTLNHLRIMYLHIQNTCYHITRCTGRVSYVYWRTSSEPLAKGLFTRTKNHRGVEAYLDARYIGEQIRTEITKG